MQAEEHGLFCGQLQNSLLLASLASTPYQVSLLGVPRALTSPHPIQNTSEHEMGLSHSSKFPVGRNHRLARYDLTMDDVDAYSLQKSYITTFSLMLYVKSRQADGTKRFAREELIHRYYQLEGRSYFVRRDENNNFTVAPSGTRLERLLPLHQYVQIHSEGDGSSISAMLTIEAIPAC